MANLLDDIQCTGSDTRPPMLDRTDFASWEQCIHLYYRGKDNRVNILKSIDEGPFQMGTFRETLAEWHEGALHLGPERPRVYSDLSPEEKERYNVDIRVTNILLQGLPKDIYTLINHYTDAKDIWDNVKMLLKGLELTKEDRESQLYDDFEYFCQHKGETIHDYYVWFTKLINDMQDIKMTMSRMQLNSMFVNNMLPEWGRFVTAVKLNRWLRDSNYDQMCAYLKQHEAHANENILMLDRFTQNTFDPLALMSNVSHQRYYSQSSTTLPSTSVQPHFADNTQLDLGLSPTDNIFKNLTNTLALLTQSYKTYLPQTNNQLRTLSNTRNQATENGVTLDEEQLFIADGQDNVVDKDADEQPVQDLALNTMFMQNLSSTDPVYDEVGPSYDLDILSEVHDHDHYQDALYEHHEVHKMQDNVQLNYVVDSYADYMSDSNMISSDQYVKDNAVPVVQSNVSSISNDAYMMILNDMHEQPAQHVFTTTQNSVVDKSLTAELATYKEQVELYERRAKFELIEREQKIDEQLRIVITDRNIKEGNLKKELHSVKCNLLLPSTITKLEAEVDQNVVHKKHDEIEGKNLLIANDNLIVDCLSKDVFYTATDSVLTVSRFSDMHEALNAAQKRIAKLEYENYNLLNKIQNDDHDARITENHNSNCVTMPVVKSKVLAPDMYVIDVETIPPRNRNNMEVHLDYLKYLKESVAPLREIV
nr:hypothetical protein [Tanacetum cinerariifolium]